MKKYVYLTLIFMCLFFIPIHNASAKTLQDLYDELEELETKYNDAKNSKNFTKAEIEKTNNELSKINEDIENTRNEIKNAQEEIIQSETDIENKKQETNEFLKFLQLSTGENTYLEYLFDAEDYTDFIYRYSVVTQMSEYNNNLIKELEILIADLEQKKINLKASQDKLEQQGKEYNSKLILLKTNLSEYEELGASIEDEISGLKKQINYYANTLKCNRNENINNCGSTPYATGWSYPLAAGSVTWEYNPSDGHYGIDLSSGYEGSPVYPAAAGVVANVISKYWCGGNMVYIYHVVNGIEYTTTYMHLLSYNVYIGQNVTTDTVIGYMGGGPSTWYYDKCTTGAHLHFGMASGHHASGFNAYSFNPRNLINFNGYFRK